MYLAEVFPKEIYDLGVAGILCMVIWGLSRGITEWLRIRSGESSSVKLQVLSDIVVKLGNLVDRNASIEKSVGKIQEDIRALHELHCGDQAWKDGRPRWYVSDAQSDKIKDMHSLIMEYDKRLSVAAKSCKDCGLGYCLVARMLENVGNRDKADKGDR